MCLQLDSKHCLQCAQQSSSIVFASAHNFLKYYLTEINTIPICSLQGEKKVCKLQSITQCHFSGDTKLASVPSSRVPTAFGQDLPVKQVKRRGFSTTGYLLQGTEEHGFQRSQEMNLSTRGANLHTESTHFQNIHKFLRLQLGHLARHHLEASSSFLHLGVIVK